MNFKWLLLVFLLRPIVLTEKLKKAEIELKMKAYQPMSKGTPNPGLYTRQALGP